MDLSVVLPCYNGSSIVQKELPGFIKYLSSLNISYEIIVVDDGSKDWEETNDICRTHHINYIRIVKNKGKGHALKTGFAKAFGSIQIFTDCDIPFDYNDLLKIYNTLKQNNHDMVIGDRTGPGSNYHVSIPIIRRAGSNLIIWFSKQFIGSEIIDTQCGLKGFTKESAKKLFMNAHSNRFAIDFELIYQARILKMRIGKIPVKMRVFYPSTLRVVKDGWISLFEITKIIIRNGFAKKNRG